MDYDGGSSSPNYPSGPTPFGSPMVAPGWYPLPDGRGEGYWDGYAWTGAARPYMQYGYQGYQPQPLAPTHGGAVASMVLGIVSLVIWYVGIVTGIIGLALGATALKQVQPNGPKRGRGMAIAGITCSIIALALWLFVLIVAISVASSVD
jgi:hypothetical protein